MRSRSVPSETHLDFDLTAYRTLFTPFIGEKVGDTWDLGRVMLWIPAVRASPRDWTSDTSDITRTKKTPGFYKVQGTAVEAIMGGIYHQFVRFCGRSHITTRECLLIVFVRIIGWYYHITRFPHAIPSPIIDKG